MTAPIIRPISDGDEARVIALGAQLGYDITAAMLADFRAHLADDDLFAVAVTGDGVAGWISAGVVRIVIMPPHVEIHGLVVDADARRQGVGRALLTAAETWAAQRGVALVRLRSNIARTAAHRFYQDCGYTLAKTSHLFTKAVATAAAQE